MLDYSEILPGRLWVGGYVRGEEVPQLKRLGITTVLSLQTDVDLGQYGITPVELARAYDAARIEFRRVPILDFDPGELERSLPAAVAQVEDALANPFARLYLHCTAGVNRSATTAAAFLIKSRRITAVEACRHLLARRDCSPAQDILERYEAALGDE